MKIIDFFKSWLVSDEQLLARIRKGEAAKHNLLGVPEEINTDTVLKALVSYGEKAGYIDPDRKEQPVSEALLSSIRNQTVKMHEEILNYYKKHNQTPDEKLLNRLTLENMFYLAMGTAILAKVKKTNLIAQGFFGKLLKKSGPDLFYREVAAMAGNTYGAENVELLHQHVQRGVIALLTSFDTKPNARDLVLECAKAMYMYGLAVTLKQKA